MSKYYIKYDSNISNRVLWLGLDNKWVELQCNALVFDNLGVAKTALASVIGSSCSSQYYIIQEKVTFDIVLSGHQLISVRLNKLADMALFGYSAGHIAEEIRKIAKEIKQ